MVQDFAKIRPESILEYRQVEAPPSWMLLFTGLISGMAVGVFGCFLFYLSGNVPPLQGDIPTIAVIEEPVVNPIPEVTNESPEQLDLQFYEELPAYEVTVDAVPVELEFFVEATPAEIVSTVPTEVNAIDGGIMFQTGAFQQRSSAENQRTRMQAIGLTNTIVKPEYIRGRTLYLVQSGPFVNSEQISNAETVLNRSNIQSLKIGLQ